ncbi:MAG TPA: hypothetical protein VFC44_22610, partial [Candidatus Saccharimonadales bacterium]|nr:hypothetical protein [Candidatus Saccharimonadales bacterium]
FTQGRPYLLTESLLICVLLAWQKQSDSRPTPLKLALTGIAFAFSAWAHGAWYLWLLLPAAFFLAGRVRDSLYLTACWLGGSFLGACLTGKPFAYLGQALFIARSIQSEHVPARLLVGEFRPSEGEFATLTLLALVYLWRRQWKTPSLFRSPVVWMIFLGWMLGFKADRFWADWGVPSALVWLALQFDDFMANAWDASAPRRLAVCALIAAPLFLDSTADLGGRYSASVRETFLDSEDANLQGWMPSRGGIFYCADMAFFYNTFYKNPSGGWRYMVGFEPALMPEDDLKIYRNIQMNQRAGQAYEGWISKMRPEDRLAVQSAAKPTAPGLEWHEAGGGWWIARKNR